MSERFILIDWKQRYRHLNKTATKGLKIANLEIENATKRLKIANLEIETATKRLKIANLEIATSVKRFFIAFQRWKLPAVI